MRQFFHDLLTGATGQHFEAIRAGTVFGLLSMTGLQLYAVVNGGGALFSPQNFGIGYATILTGGGAAVVYDRLKNGPSTPPPTGDQ